MREYHITLKNEMHIALNSNNNRLIASVIGIVLLLIAGSLIYVFTGKGVVMAEHAVIVSFTYGTTDLSPLFELEEKLEAAIAAAQAGEFDGNEVSADGSEGSLYMYGPDADRLFDVIKPVLVQSPFMVGASVTKRYGPPEDGVREVTLHLEVPADMRVEEGLDADTCYNKGLDAYRDQRYRDSLAYFNNALELKPNDSEAFYSRAMVKSILKDTAGALRDYDKAIALDPKYRQAYGNRGAEKDEQGDYDGAIKDYNKAIELAPDSPVAYFNRGNTKYRKGDKKGACADWNKAKELGDETAQERLDRYCR